MVGNNISLLILGTGAMACLFAARLSEAGVQVAMSGAWREGLRALKSHGVRLVDEAGSERAFTVRVIEAAGDKAAECTGVKYSLVLVKSWQTPRAARQLAGCLDSDGLALTLQNGYGNRERLVEALGEARVALGVTTVGATLLGPGRVRQAGVGHISLSERPSLGQLPEWLEAAGFGLSVVADTEALLWGKLVVNAAINPLTGLLGVQNGELLSRAPARALMADSAREAVAVAQAMGIRLPYDDPVGVVESVARDTAKNRSSMLQDLSRGAPTEIDAISGAVVRAGERLGVPTPVNRCLWQLVRASELEAA